MATYRVQGPDGQVHRFEGPDNATPAEVEAAARAQFSHPVVAGGSQADQPGLVQQGLTGVRNYALGRVKGGLAVIDGGAQLLANGMAGAAHYVAPGSGVDQWAAGEAKRVNDINTQREKIYQLMTPGSTAAGLGYLQSQVMMPIKGIQAARGASILGKAVAGAGTGAAIGASQPVYGAGEKDLSSLVTGTAPIDYWDEKAKQIALGAALGGGLSTVGAGIGATANALRPIFSPKSTVGDQLLNGLAKAKEAARSQAAVAPSTASTASALDGGSLVGLTGSRNPADVLARLREAQSLVPGSMPTTAQVAGVPELVMAEKVLKNNPAYRGAFEDRSIANNAARLGELLKVAKTPQHLQDAVAARSAEAGPLYDAAKAATMPIDSSLTDLLSRPSAQAAIARGKKLAAERGEDVALDNAAPATTQASSILDGSGKPFTSELPASPGSISGNVLQYLKMGLDDLQTD